MAGLLAQLRDKVAGNTPEPCPPREDGAVVHRTRMLTDSNGDLVGRSCPCGGIYTPAGNPSQIGPAGDVSKAHTVRTLAHLTR